MIWTNLRFWKSKPASLVILGVQVCAFFQDVSREVSNLLVLELFSRLAGQGFFKLRSMLKITKFN